MAQQPTEDVKQSDPVLLKMIDSSISKFENSVLDFEKEKVFAFGALAQNNLLLQYAVKNPTSLKMAMYNVASIGLSLNPVTKLAYLVPRRVSKVSKVVLDISYQGLIEIATQAGAIKACSVTLVREKDLETFEWRDNFTPPRNPPNPFVKDKGNIVGGYCQALLPDGRFILHAMTIDEIEKRRDASEMVKSRGVSGPWLDWREEMIMKTIVKSAAKWWPSNGSQVLAEAQRLLNEENGEGLPPEERIINGNVVTPTASAELPPPPSRDELPEKLVKYVDRAVDRAEQLEAWQTCEDHLIEKFSDLHQRSFALDQLRNRQAAFEESNPDSQVA
ncbi:RecT family recombinase [Marinobacterium weihaiense]|uniref:Recombinase RecT n=1 Tax=Marinobacterium weihaiense TaxID=2851016 RepID=A0ABS6MEI4_9GAMM|nr:RecT family recombinase [Marinobacterium weihaiense]MBV0934722.1 recombinase RecT [Marinobacterium weihaiense]